MPSKNRLSAIDAGFAAIIGVTYFSALVRLRYGGWANYTRLDLAVLGIASLLYLCIGVFGFTWCRQKLAVGFTVSYLVVQALLAEIILELLPSPVAFLVILPLAGQAYMLLPRRGATLFAVLLLLTLATPIGVRYGPFPALVASCFFLAGLVFVITFTLVALNESNARRQVQRLADQLSEANQRLQEYASQAEEVATLRERARLAREIHDSLGHYLTAVNVLTEAARATLAAEPERAGEILEQAQSLTREGLAEVRLAVTQIRDSMVDLRPLPETLELMVEECRATQIDATLEVIGQPMTTSPETRLTLYRAAQEGITNIRRHAKASKVSFKLDYSDAALVRLLIEDNGVGGENGCNGFGLAGIRERVRLLGGELSVRAEPGAGFVLKLELPR